MSERDAFDRILASLHKATLDDVHWPTTSGLMDDVLRAKGNSLVFGAGHPRDGIRIFYAGFFYRGQRHREWEREYFDLYYPVDERVPRVRCLPDSQPVQTIDLYTDSELKTSPAYNESLLRGHVQNGINVRLDGPNGTRIVWVINDPIDTGGWSSAQIELIQRLLPGIRQYVSVRHVLAGAEALGTSLTGLLDNTGVGVIQLDWRGRIVEANDCARDLLRTGEGVFDSHGFLFARFPADNADLQELLARALPPFGRQGTSGSMTVRRSASLRPLVLHVNPVGPQEAELRTWAAAALVLVVDPRRETRIDPDPVAAGLGLTPMESRVAAMLAEGMTVREITAATGRKENTIRWHVRRIFRKQGITRQAELVRLVLSIAGTPDARR